MDQEWVMQARCRGTEDQLFAESARQREVRQFCRECAVWDHCLAEALDNRIEWGIWGGLTERERRSLLRRRPDVESWRDLLLRHRPPRVTAG